MSDLSSGAWRIDRAYAVTVSDIGSIRHLPPKSLLDMEVESRAKDMPQKVSVTFSCRCYRCVLVARGICDGLNL